MALELIGGAVFTVLYDGVKMALGQTATFKYLLKDLKSTLESLSRVRATALQQIGEYNVVLSLPTEEIEDLKKQMEDGIKLVDKLSNFHIWNYCCINCFTNELVELDRSLRRLLNNLLVQQARDVKEILDLSRKNRKDLDELKIILLNMQQTLQKTGDVMESSASGSNPETTPNQNEGNSKEYGAASLEGAALGAAFGILFGAVKGAEEKTTIFRSFLRDIKTTLDSLKPLVEEMGVDSLVQYNKVLHRPKEEIEKFRIQLEMGVELVRKCSKVGLWSFYKKFEFTNQLLALDESLRRELYILREQVARDVRETSASISNIKMEVKQIEGSGVVQNQLKIQGLCEVPEPHDGILGSGDVIEGTMISERNIEVGDKGVDEGSSVVQNQFEIEGSCEVPKPAPSPKVELEQLIVKKQQRKRFLNFKKLKLPRKTRDVEETSLKGLPDNYTDHDREAIPRRFSYKELVTATNNFSNERKLGEGGFGAVYKGYLITDKHIEIAVKKFSSEYRQGRKEYITEVKVINSLRHRNLVQLIGWCHDGGQSLLVYEFMPNGSLDSHLFGMRSALLTWDVRYKISLGLANALLYLHEELEQCVLHRDIKTSNILLDSSFNAKLSDFGIALLMDHELSHQTTELCGTHGYMAPEYQSTGRASKESDVYSFGVIALEIATGKRRIDTLRYTEMELVEWVWDLYGQGNLVLAVDERLNLKYDEKQVECLMIAGLCCAHPDPRMRPSVREAIQILNFEAALPNLQTKIPGLYHVPTLPKAASREDLRKKQKDLDELKGIPLNTQQFQQKSGDVMDSLASGSNTETTPKQNEGNSEEQAASLEGAALGAAFGILYEAVKGAEDKTIMFRSFLRDIKSTLDSLKPLVEEMVVDSLVQHNKVLDHPKEEIEKFRIQLEMGVVLVRKCSKVGVWSYYKKFEFSNQLLALDESLKKQLYILRETSASISNIKMEVKQIEDLCEVPEPHQGDAIEGTVISERNIEVGDKGVDEGSSVELNQSEIEGSCEVPKPAPSPKVDLEQLIVKKHQRKRFVNFKKLKLPPKKMDVEETSLEGLPKNYKDFEREARPRRFSYKELVTATSNFSSKLGEGGFGGVYKGYLTDLDMVVAVKNFSRGSEQRKKEHCITEVKILGSLRHRNLVQLIGWCHYGGQSLLVYEFMPEGSLDSHLFGMRSAPLTWDVRYKISLGLANALLYLHEELEQCVLHRGIKTRNILLDFSFNVKLSDFGMALLMDHELSHQTTELAGTLGYLAPEYLSTGRASKESDVYSFGVVALEIATGKKRIHILRKDTEVELVEWVWDLYGQGNLVLAVDERLQLKYDEKQVECLMIVGLCCVHPDPRMRPSVREAIKILNFEAAWPNLETKMPALYHLPTLPKVSSRQDLSSEILEEGR